MLVTAGLTQFNRILFVWNEDKVIEKLMENPKLLARYDEVVAQKKTSIDNTLGYITSVHKIVLEHESAVGNFSNDVSRLYGELTQLRRLARTLEDITQTLASQSAATVTNVVEAAQSDVDQLEEELFQIFFNPTRKRGTATTRPNHCASLKRPVRLVPHWRPTLSPYWVIRRRTWSFCLCVHTKPATVDTGELK